MSSGLGRGLTKFGRELEFKSHQERVRVGFTCNIIYLKIFTIITFV